MKWATWVHSSIVCRRKEKKKGKRKAVRDEEIHYQIMPGDYFNGWVERGAAEDTEEKKKEKRTENVHNST